MTEAAFSRLSSDPPKVGTTLNSASTSITQSIERSQNTFRDLKAAAEAIGETIRDGKKQVSEQCTNP